ncbi:hypothetical protein Rhopal_005573-T1 [Rhodotorula paludigena]|uniref:Replication factor C subunit 1 n=1 Tax=Rhodotorula paludigena TaxID=86838 RepID=A0AAV5GVD2_9BASI|nr:hypothetical protein Rhopal_005573-T1 [Rhodotorula paludigena]
MPPKRVLPPSDDSDPDSAPAATTKKRPSSAAVLTLSSDDDDDAPQPAKKKKTNTGAASTAKKATGKGKGKGKDDDDFVVADDDDGESSDDGGKGAKMQLDDNDDDDVKPKKKKPISMPKASTSSAATKSKSASTSSTKASSAATAGKDKKVKDEGADAKPKFKWKPKERAGPSAPGSKEIPDAAPDCLAGLTFVFTGELESLSREQGQELVKRYGGRVTTAPSSKTSYVVLGTDAGPKKLEVITKHRLQTLDEDGFLKLLASREADPDDPKVRKLKEAEEKKVKEAAKSLTLTKDAPEHLTQLWTTKYAPQRLAEICGNKGHVEKLQRWLEAWPKSLASGFKKPGADAMNTFRCVLISGPPGIGKTTSAHLVAKLLGYDVLELNASDTRSKKLLEEAFRSKTSDTTLAGFLKKPGEERDPNTGLTVNTKSLIIMDEVDGMSAGDRGGVGALNAVIRKTKVPIIAIANDAKSQKMKPLLSTCFQMTFKRPTAQEIRSRVMSIAFKEGLKIDGKVVDQLVAGSQSDIRQIVNMLATYKLGAQALDFDQGKKLVKMNEKNAIQTPWTLYSKLTGPQAFSNVSGLSLTDKLEVYFQDFSIMPLFVQENYLKGRFSRAGGAGGGGGGPEAQLKNLDLACKAAESISDGDLVDAMIHGTQQQWSLMPLHGMLSCVRPASFIYGQGGGYPNFPAWLGKNSTQNKLNRQLAEIQIRMRLRASGDKRELRQSYLPTLFSSLVQPLQDRGTDAVDDVIRRLDDYFLGKEEWDAIVEMGVGEGRGMEQVLKSIPSQTKAAFTRRYNAADHPIAYYKPEPGRAKAKKLAPAGDAPDLEEAFVDEDLAEADADDDDGANSDASSDPGKDRMIKAKKPKGTAAAKKSASTSGTKGKAKK